MQNACVGRFLLPDCKRKSNHEGLGSSLTFHRATVAYALLFNLTITSEPCARPQTFSLTQTSLTDRRTTLRRLIVGHGLGAAAHSWLGLDRGAHCSRCSGARLQADGAMRRHAVDEVVDWGDAAGGGELRDAAAGRPRSRSFGEAAARLAGEGSIVLELRGCPRLTVPLAGGLADRTEDAIRHGFELSRRLRGSVPLPWADRPATELQVASQPR
jgi:hypothetical protein